MTDINVKSFNTSEVKCFPQNNTLKCIVGKFVTQDDDSKIAVMFGKDVTVEKEFNSCELQEDLIKCYKKDWVMNKYEL